MRTYRSFILFIFSLSCAFSLQASLSEETIYLTWQKAPQSTMTIQWISPSQEKETLVSYYKNDSQDIRESQCGITFPFPNSPQYAIHRVELCNLSANTLYTFSISKEGNSYCFLTAPCEIKEDLHFIVSGDQYQDTEARMVKTARVAAQKNPLFVAIGGDIAYAVRGNVENNERWIEWIKIWHKEMVSPLNDNPSSSIDQKNLQPQRLIPVIAAIGNHDLLGKFNQTNQQAAVFKALFAMPGEQTFTVLDFCDYLSLVLLDSGHANQIEGTQTQWLDAVLESRKHIFHRFAIYHVPAYPSVRNQNGSQNVAIRKSWVPLFEKWRLHAAFEHHDHAYKRTFPLLHNEINPQGILYLGDGGWGVDEPRKQTTARLYIAKFASVRHFIFVTLTKRGQLFQCISEDGIVVDEYYQYFSNQ